MVRPDGAYLITGAFGGYGKVVADWLVDCGARHLVLTSRSGAASPEAGKLVEKLTARGASVQVIKADVGVPGDVARMMAEIAAAGAPLRGVFHLAMVIDDMLMSGLDRERMRSVMAPKSYGALLLHEATQDMELDCFAMFSSVSSIFGNPAQANYSAANAFLDALAHHRRASGLPATTINWGVLGRRGLRGAQHVKVAEFLAKQGTTEITPREVTQLLEIRPGRRGSADDGDPRGLGQVAAVSSAAWRTTRCWNAFSPRWKTRKRRAVPTTCARRSSRPDRANWRR